MVQRFVSLPPGPKTPAAWQLLHYSHSPLSFLEECARRYGDPFSTWPLSITPVRQRGDQIGAGEVTIGIPIPGRPPRVSSKRVLVLAAGEVRAGTIASSLAENFKLRLTSRGGRTGVDLAEPLVERPPGREGCDIPAAP